jgi:hypothetical protein
MVFMLDRQPCFDKKILPVAIVECTLSKSIALFKTVACFKFLKRILLEASLFEI